MSHTHTRQVQTSRTLNIYYITANFAFHLSQAERLPQFQRRNIAVRRECVRVRVNEIRFVFISFMSFHSQRKIRSNR